MKHDNHKTIAFKEREEHHISKYRFKSDKNGNIDFKVIPYPKYKILRKGRKLIKLKNIYIFLLIILIACAYFFITNKRLTNSIDKFKLTSYNQRYMIESTFPIHPLIKI